MYVSFGFGRQFLFGFPTSKRGLSLLPPRQWGLVNVSTCLFFLSTVTRQLPFYLFSFFESVGFHLDEAGASPLHFSEQAGLSFVFYRIPFCCRQWRPGPLSPAMFSAPTTPLIPFFSGPVDEHVRVMRFNFPFVRFAACSR